MANHAVITLAIGRVGYWRWTHPVMRRYADRIGADFIKISHQQQAHADRLGYRLEKFQIYDYLARYERVIFLDGDILLRPDCPDLFSLTPPDKLGVMCEGKFYRRDVVFAEAAQFYGIDRPMASSEWFNTGVMVISRSHRPMFVAPAAIKPFASYLPDGSVSANIWMDMPLFNCLRVLCEIELVDLGLRFNYLGSMKNQPFRPFEPEDAFIFHGSGPGKSYLRSLVKRLYGARYYYWAYVRERFRA